MHPQKRSKLLIRLGIVLLVVGIVLLTVAFVRAAPAPPPVRVGTGFIPIFAQTNGTKNATTNKTAPACSAQANDECYNTTLAISQNLARFIGYANGVLNTLIYGFVILAAFVVFTELLLVRWVRETVKAMKERKMGPDDPRSFEMFIPMLAHALPEADRRTFEDRARKEALTEVQRRLAEAKGKKAKDAT